MLLPVLFGTGFLFIYWCTPFRPSLFSDDGILVLCRDTMGIFVPFLFSALAAVALATSGYARLDARPRGPDLFLSGTPLTLRQFVCYLLGYLTFTGLFLFILSASALLLKPAFAITVSNVPELRELLLFVLTAFLSYVSSSFFITVLWALYFLTEVLNDSG